MSRRRQQKQVVKEHVVRTVVGVEDMILLPDTKDSGIAANLKVRLQSELIYTSIGHVLVVCNPYKWLPIYSEEVMKRYTLQQRVDVPPHIFATAEAAYRTMIQEEDNQCVIISGESGAGKTEASKQIQSYIAKVSGGGAKVEQTKKVFLESNPVLEAFGNAKTLRNNNSSRFGKYFELKFDRFGAPIGGLITNYLLEKSRIVKPGKGERNFHIFYQLLKSSGAESLGVNQPASSFTYLQGGGKGGGCEATVDGVDDAKEMEITLNAMKSVGMKNGQIKSILSLVAAVLHLGNIEFETVQVENAEGSRLITKSSTASGKAVQQVCALLGVEAGALTQCLTYRELQTMAPGGKTDTYQIPQNVTQAAARRDAIAKAIYEQLFDLIVERINVALDPAAAEDVKNQGVDLDVDVLSIGVLDIYGFEVFDHNGFEQLCINYVNEKLQQIFIELTLNAEQLEYADEGIAWQPIPFFNNKIVCELLDGQRPSGLFRVLDDTCKTMHGTQAGADVDRKFLETARQLHANHAHFRPVPNAFIVKHYAGEVTYDCGKLGESNKDALDNDLLSLIKSSGDKLLVHLFRDHQVTTSGGSTVPSAGTRIRQQCQLLVTALMECTPHYVRCVKSNDEKRALTMDMSRVQHQVKYLGLSENIKVRRAGFAYRNDFHRFLDRFAILSSATYPEWQGSDKNGCKEILKAIDKMTLPDGLNLQNEVQLGKNKLFIRTPEMYFAIEQLRERQFEKYVERIQRAYRRYRNSRELVSLQGLMHTLYAEQRKTRRRESIYCPFSGDSLHQLNASFLATSAAGRATAADDEAAKEFFRESMYRIIDHYSATETVLFVDPHAAQIVRSTAKVPEGTVGCGAGYATQPRVLVLTTAAIYLMERLTPAMWLERQIAAGVPKTDYANRKPPGVLILRRRIPLPVPPNGKAVQHISCDGTELGAFLGLVMSTLADCAVMLKMTMSATPISAAQAMEKERSSWVPYDSNTNNKCFVTGVPFSWFNRHHHCRITGQVVSAPASMHSQPLPDKQLYTPQRICDPVIGLVSTDPLEDTILLTERRTEFAALVATQCLVLRGGSNVQPTAPALASVIGFSNVLKPQPNTLVPANVSLIPASEVVIKEVPPKPSAAGAGKKGKAGAAAAPAVPAAWRVLTDCSLAMEGGKLILSCGVDGISHQAVQERRARQLQRQKDAQKRRRRLEKEQQERRAAREQEREALRLQRLAERKARKLAEREARRRRAEASSGASSSASAKSVKSSNSFTRLSAAAADAPPPAPVPSAARLRPTPGVQRESSASAMSREPSNNSLADISAGNSAPNSGPPSRSRTPPVGLPGAGTGGASSARAAGGAGGGGGGGGGVMVKQASAGSDELMAAMARRRAKMQD